MPSLIGTVLSSDIMRGIVNQCSITNVTPLKDVMQQYNITGGERLIEDYQCSLVKYLLKLRVRYLFGSSKDILNAETIIFILDWTPDDTSFLSIRHLLYKTFIDLDKMIIFQATGKKNFAFLKYFINYDVKTYIFMLRLL